MSLKVRFKVGDKAVYPQKGVGEVVAVEERTIAGRNVQVYVLKFPNGMTLMVPTLKADASLREVISKKTAIEVIDTLKKSEITVTAQPWNRRKKEYEEMLYSGSPFEVAKVLRDLALRTRHGKELSHSEKELLARARGFLVAELALAKRVTEARVDEEIRGILTA